MLVRSATPNDAAAIADIYNQGLEDRIATFETRFRSAEDVQAWFDGMHPVLVVENESEIIAFASTSAYSVQPTSNATSAVVEQAVWY
jgi:phosphinothricin acetyltransferase